jgi:hypothetical protein
MKHWPPRQWLGRDTRRRGHINPPRDGGPRTSEHVADTSDHADAPAKPKPKHAIFEPIALVLLSLATVGTAWCSYQAAVWGAVSQRTMNLSAAAGRKAAAIQLQSHQMALLDVLLFTQYINARAGSSNGMVRSDSQVSALEKFYADRFRSEAKTAFNAWMATRPFENPDAPPHPFVTNLYQPRLLTEAAGAEAESQRLWQQAGDAGRNGRSYVLITVLFTCALFCGGTASKFDAPWVRRAVLALGLTAFTIAAIRLFLLPMRL